MSSPHPDISYRADIDGLRAFAVLPVVLFHAGLESFGGGYVGVDVFFVISGFLITGILLKDGSIGRFYQRRARRILPALFAVLACSMAASLIILLPHDLIEYCKSQIATLLFGSNIFFWRQAGYFATETELWPLLHTWSLGVEEQFYIFFPLILLVIKRLSRTHLTAIIALMALLSFGMTIMAMNYQKGVIAFYLVPMRAWELLVGSLLAVGALPAIRSRMMRTAVAAAGLAALIVPVLAYSSATPFPGWAALPPVLGSAMVIWAGQHNDHHLYSIIGCRPLRFIGLISYSLYLWHWPVLVFIRYVHVSPIGLVEGVIAVLLSLVLAVISWRYVERPFRRGFSNRRIWALSASGIMILGLAALTIIYNDGLPRRFSPAVAALNSEQGNTWRCPITTMVPFGGYYACPVNLPSGAADDADVVLWGDSHAQMYVPALRKALDGRHALLVNANGCAPVLGDGATPGCGAVQRGNYEAILRLPARTVILAQNWPQYRDEASIRLGRDLKPSERYGDGIRRLRELVTGLRREGRTVLIIPPVPLPGYQLASVASRDLAFHGEVHTSLGVRRADYEQEYANVLDAMTTLASEDKGVRLVRVDRIACPESRCDFVHEGRAIFADQGHYATSFAENFAPAFREALREANHK